MGVKINGEGEKSLLNLINGGVWGGGGTSKYLLISVMDEKRDINV